MAEDAADALPEARHKATSKLADDLVGRVVRFAVDQFDQHTPLGAGHALRYGSVLVEYLLVTLLDVFANFEPISFSLVKFLKEE